MSLSEHNLSMLGLSAHTVIIFNRATKVTSGSKLRHISSRHSSGDVGREFNPLKPSVSYVIHVFLRLLHRQCSFFYFTLKKTFLMTPLQKYSVIQNSYMQIKI